jgi:glycosyltransferase involved in cell wall biosynthesis
VSCVIRGRKPPEDFNDRNLILIKLPDCLFPLSLFTYLISFLIIGIEAILKRPALIYQRDSGINVAVIVGKLLRIPTLLEINGDIMHDNTFSSRIIMRLLSFTVKITYSNTDVITSPSKDLVLTLRSYGVNEKRAFVIPNGVNTKVFYPMNKDFCRRRIGFSANCIYFCFVGTLLPWQGIEKALFAFSEFLKETNFNAKLAIVGDGPLKEKLRRLTKDLRLEDDVLFLGYVPHKTVPIYINACDICIAPFTSWRNMLIGVSPLKFFEYLSCGKPVIASAVPGLTEIIKELDAGILVDPDNIGDLKNAYHEACKKLPYWEKRTHILYKKVCTHYSWDKRVDYILNIIKPLLQ